MLSVETDGPDEGITIIAAAENAAGRSVGPVDIAHAGQVAVAAVVAVGVGLADGPVEGACCLAQCRGGIAVGVVGDGVDGLAGLSVEHRQVFMSAVHVSAAGNPRLGVVGSLDGGVVGGLVDIIALAVLRTGGCLAHHLDLAVAVEVIDHILCIVGTGTDVLPQVYAPEQLRRAIAGGTVAPVHLVAVDDDIARDTVLRVVFRVGRIPFQEQFILSVAVHIAYAHVVGTVGVGSAAGRAAGGSVQLYGLVGLAPGGDLGRGLHFLTVDLGDYLIGRSGLARLVGVVGGIEVGGDPAAVAVEVEGRCALVVSAQETPTDEVAGTGRQGYQAAVQFLHLADRRVLCTGSRSHCRA